MDKKIFISYSRKDITIAREIKKKVETMTSVRCWMDMEGIESGSQFQDVIISAINAAKIVLLLLSENSMQSPWVKKEINFAYEKHKKVIPINIDGSQPADWFLFIFAGNDVIDFRNKDQQKKFYNNIVGWCSRPPLEPIKSTEGIGEPSPIPYLGEEKNSNSIEFNSLTEYGIYFQYLVWGLLGLVSLWISVTGSLRVGHSLLALLLDLLIVGSLVSTFLLDKGKKYAFFLICLLDFIELMVVCKMGAEVYAISPKGGFGTAVYTNLWGLGAYIKWKSFIFTYVILSISAFVHIALMTVLLKLKNNFGKSGWSQLT